MVKGLRVLCFFNFAQCGVQFEVQDHNNITLSSQLKQLVAYQSSSSTRAACRQRLAIVLIVTISPAET